VGWRARAHLTNRCSGHRTRCPIVCSSLRSLYRTQSASACNATDRGVRPNKNNEPENVNKRDLEKKLHPITDNLFKTKGYICLTDVFVGLGYLTEKDVENWRFRKVPYLEKSIKVNLSKISFICKVVHSNCKNGKLRESRTAYMSWGKGKKQILQFSKTGRKEIEDAYSTHYLKPEKHA